MELFKHYILILLILICYLNRNYVSAEEYCPTNCECDSFEGFNRAYCREQNLISANLQISPYVQILSLDENEISILDNDCFKPLIHITNLSIAYNSIHTIYSAAFSTLRKLKSINLSNNRLEFINPQIFEKNKQLIEVNLSGNKFMSFPNQPIFISASVEILFLHNSQINHIYPNLFSKIPSLRQLDLSDNLMITLTTEPFNELIELTEINLENNRWICDKNIENFIKYLKSKKVNVELNMCHFELRKSGNGDMFQKMMVDPNLNLIDKELDPIAIISVWQILNDTDIDLESCMDEDQQHVCTLYNMCLKNVTILEHLLENSQSKQTNSGNSYDFLRLIDNTQLVFYFGICVGAALVFVMVACTLCALHICKPKKKKKLKSKFNDTECANSEFRYVHVEHPVTTANSSNIIAENPPFVPVRISSRRNQRQRRAAPHPPINRSISTSGGSRQPIATVNDFASFIGRIFERPSRHRYYQTFNQNTTQLIRRLSRSSLVNNRLSQHFLNETIRNRNERNRNGTESEQITGQSIIPNQNQNSVQETESLLPVPDEIILVRPISLRDDEVTAPRAETPPPSYVDVINN